MSGRRGLLCCCLAVFAAAIIVGCQQPQMNMADMKPPPRASELDKLDAMVGNWES